MRVPPRRMRPYTPRSRGRRRCRKRRLSSFPTRESATTTSDPTTLLRSPAAPREVASAHESHVNELAIVHEHESGDFFGSAAHRDAHYGTSTTGNGALGRGPASIGVPPTTRLIPTVIDLSFPVASSTFFSSRLADRSVS